MCPQPSAWTQIKKETRIARTWHGLVFHGFFWYYWANDSWIWGWFIGICECWGTPFSWRYRYCYSAYRQQPPPNLKPILTFPKGRNRLLRQSYQPPPSLPRRGGTDTIDCMTVVCSCLIIVCSYQIINRLSTAIVTVPPLRGRLGGGWCDWLKSEAE